MGGRLGLTGGIGSGKSTVANLLRIRGAFIIDADAISRACTAPQGAAMPAIAHAFGPDVIDANGGLDREIMRQRVFNDATARSRLEQIVHPVVGQQIAQQAHLAETAVLAFIALQGNCTGCHTIDGDRPAVASSPGDHLNT